MRLAPFVIAAAACALATPADAQRLDDQRAVVIVGGTAVVATVVGALRPYERWRRVR